MKKQLTPAAITALKEALSNIYWYKSDFKTFLFNSLPENVDVSRINWSLTKREISSIIIDRLANLKCAEVLLKLAQDICQFNNFDHLKHIDNWEDKILKAQNAVNHLKEFIIPYQDGLKDEKKTKGAYKTSRREIIFFQKSTRRISSLKTRVLFLSN